MPTKIDIKENTFNPSMNFFNGGSVILEHDAYVTTTGDNGFETNEGPWTFTIDGVIQSDISGMDLYDVGVTAPIKNSTVIVGTEGVVFGGGADGVFAEQATNVVNSGWIEGKTYGIEYDISAPSSTKVITITNNVTGEIRGTNAGIKDADAAHSLAINNKGFIEGVEWTGALSLTNSGTITYLLQLNPFEAAATITNTGFINGSVTTGEGNDVVKNTGQVDGTLDVVDGNNKVTTSGHIFFDLIGGSGNDVFVNSGVIDGAVTPNGGTNALINSGTIGSAVTFGTGDDTMSNSGTIDQKVEMGVGNNKFTNSGQIAGAVDFGNGGDQGNNVAINSGHIASIAFGFGDDTLINSGTIDSFVDLSAGANKVVNTGTIGDFVTFAGGANSLVNGGTIVGNVFGSLLKETVTNTKLIEGNIELGNGDNVISNGGTIDGHVTTLADADTFKNTHIVKSDVDLGAGANTFFNSGTIDGNVTAGTGASGDIFTNTKIITGTVNFGDGSNIITNTGSIGGILSAGDGNDTVVNTGSIHGTIDLGDGNNTFTDGNFTEDVRSGDGNDVYKLGGGNDAVSFFGGGTDFFDGGTGSNLLDAFFRPTGIQVNLDTKAVTVAGHTLAAASIHSSGEAGTIKNFQDVAGSVTADDILVGGAAKEELDGGGGNDVIAGGGGADNLSGGTGNDIFAYLHIADSGNTIATRDVIHDFEGAGAAGGDVIDLGAIDADTKTAGDQAFHLIGADTPFTHAAGELRWVHTPTDTIIQGDVNGDGKADFSIDVVGTQTFVDGDFVK